MASLERIKRILKIRPFTFRCRENDNRIKFIFLNGEIDEVRVNVIGEKSWVVIGYKDLTESIRKAELVLNRNLNQIK